jgi:hypothetical protein
VEKLWNMLFQTDRFLSLMLGTPYALADTDCNPSSKIEKTIQRLAVLVGKVIDHTKNKQSISCSSILEIDKDLRNFYSQLLTDPRRHPPPPLSLSNTSLKGPEVELPILFFHQALLMLHLPWMLRSLNDTSLEYSRSCCFQSARAILLLFQESRVTNSRLSENKCAPIDLVAFVAAAILCLGQFGYAPTTDDASHVTGDNVLIHWVMGGFKRIRTQIASESIENLNELIRLRDEWGRAESVPSKISIPFLGEVLIPENPTTRSTNTFLLVHAGLWAQTHPIHAIWSTQL